jgi:hypothetical protein
MRGGVYWGLAKRSSESLDSLSLGEYAVDQCIEWETFNKDKPEIGI